MDWYRIKFFIAYYFSALTKFNAQSPFLFDFITYVLDTGKKFYVFDDIEKEREKLVKSTLAIDIEDFGAGSKNGPTRQKCIGEIAKSSLSKKSKCQILFNLVLYLRCNHILELGTSLGISSSYMAAASKKTQIITLEGDKSIASIAKSVHERLGLKNTMVIDGRFSSTLPSALNKLQTIDLAFIDGHHQGQATLEYFHQIATKCHNESVVVIDDIYWSQDMQNAWQELISLPNVSLSIDLFDMGIIFFKKELSKENIAYIPYHFKPWRIGLFG